MPEPLPFSLLDDLAGPEESLAARIALAVDAHPSMEQALAPIGEVLIDASIDLVLQLHRHDQTLTIRGKIGAFGCVFAIPTEPGATDGWWQVAGAAGGPRLVAQAVGLGPRSLHRHAGRILPLPGEALLTCCGRSGFEAPAGQLIETMVADGLPRRPLEAILSRDALLWHLQLHADGATEAAMSLAVVDTDRHGLWLALDTPGGALLQSATSTGIWRALCHTLAMHPVVV